MSEYLVYGGVYLIQLDPSKGIEVGKKRPCVILQSDILNRCTIKTYIVMPLSSQYRLELSALRVKILAKEKLLQDSYVLLEHIRSVSLSRINPAKLAQLTSSELAEIKSKFSKILG